MQRPEYAVLGATGVDKVTKLKGVITAIYYNITHATQYAIQPPGKGDKIPESWSIDAENVTVTGKLKKPLEVSDTTVELGDEVEDQVTGFTGITTVMSVSMNGCVAFVVVGKCIKGEKAKVEQYDHKRLTVLNKGAFVPKPSERGALPSRAHKMSA